MHKRKGHRGSSWGCSGAVSPFCQPRVAAGRGRPAVSSPAASLPLCGLPGSRPGADATTALVLGSSSTFGWQGKEKCCFYDVNGPYLLTGIGFSFCYRCSSMRLFVLCCTVHQELLPPKRQMKCSGIRLTLHNYNYWEKKDVLKCKQGSPSPRLRGCPSGPVSSLSRGELCERCPAALHVVLLLSSPLPRTSCSLHHGSREA